MLQRDVIKSVGYDQQEIINNILTLYNKGNPIDFDPCYNKGGFYRNGKVIEPTIKSDINPLLQGVEKLDVCYLPFFDKFKCIMFDPPFLVSGGAGGKMMKRFGSFESVDALKKFYKMALTSLHRALKRNGILIIKTQDFVNGRRNYILMPEIISMARDVGLEIKDLFILVAKSRPNKIKNQQHARKYHSYFLVFKKI